jgi:hypothetical protein
MAQIYTVATQILIWLGLELASSKLAFDTIEEVRLAAKYRVWSYHAAKLGVELHQLSDEMVRNSVLGEWITFDEQTRICQFMGRYDRDLGMYQMDSLLTLLRETPMDICDDNTVKSSFASGSLAMWLMSEGLSIDDIGNLDAGLDACAQEFEQHPWWDRLWVIQEVINSQTAVLCCGYRTVTFSCIELMRMMAQKGFLPMLTVEYLCPLSFGLPLHRCSRLLRGTTKIMRNPCNHCPISWECSRIKSAQIREISFTAKD